MGEFYIRQGSLVLSEEICGFLKKLDENKELDWIKLFEYINLVFEELSSVSIDIKEIKN